MKVSTLRSGPPVVLAEGFALAFGSCSWGRDGYLYLATTVGAVRIPELGGSLETVVSLAEGEANYFAPRIMPGERQLILSVNSVSGPWRMTLADLDTGTRTVVADTPAAAMRATFLPVSPDATLGYYVAVGASGVFAAPFDLERPVALAMSPVQNAPPPNLATSVSVSRSGTLVYLDRVPTNDRRLVWVARDGAEIEIEEPAHNYATGSLSADGRYAATGIFGAGGGLDIWVHDLELNRSTRATFGEFNSPGPFTPDGQHVLVVSSPTVTTREREVRSVRADGGGAPVALGAFQSTSGPEAFGPTSMSPDGRALLGMSFADPENSDIWVLRLDESDGATEARRASPLFAETYNERHAMFSPDGRFIAYTSDESGRDEVYVVPYPATGAKWQVSTRGGGFPQWSSNGRELFFLSSTTMMAAAVEVAPVFRVVSTVTLFDAARYGHADRPFGVVADGTRFLMQKPIIEQPTAVNVVMNWGEELRRAMPLRSR